MSIWDTRLAPRRTNTRRSYIIRLGRHRVPYHPYGSLIKPLSLVYDLHTQRHNARSISKGEHTNAHTTHKIPGCHHQLLYPKTNNKALRSTSPHHHSTQPKRSNLITIEMIWNWNVGFSLLVSILSTWGCGRINKKLNNNSLSHMDIRVYFIRNWRTLRSKSPEINIDMCLFVCFSCRRSRITIYETLLSYAR